MNSKDPGIIPHSFQAEQALIGAILYNPACINEVQEILKSEVYFYNTQNKTIYAALLNMLKHGKGIDAIILGEELLANNSLEIAGGMEYISEIIDKVTSYSNAVYYANIIKDKYILRTLINKTNNILKQCYENPSDVKGVVHEAEQSIFQLSDETVSEGFKHINHYLETIIKQIEHLYKHKEQVPGVFSGYEALDKKTSGFQKSDLIIVAARPSMGKTSFAMNLAYNAANKHKIPVAVFSLEMSSEQIVQRLISLAAKVPMSKIRSGFLEETDWMKLVTANEILNETPIYIDNTYGIDPVTMMSKIRRLKTEVDLGMIIIDYLQMMKLGGRVESRQQEVSEISRSLKGLAREFNIPVIVLSQLSRQLESRQDKKPQLSDLRESGAIEQDADLVMFVYREEKYNPETERKGIADIIIGKHRNGPLGEIPLTFLEQYMSFENCELEPYEEF